MQNIVPVNVKQLLIIAGSPANLYQHQGKLCVDQHGVQRSFPWHQLLAVLCIGNQHLTMPALRGAMHAGVSIHLANRFGRYSGVCSGAFQEPSCLTQAQALQDYLTDNRLSLARGWVSRRIENIYQLVRKRQCTSENLKRLLSSRDKAAEALTLDSLRGIEGSASKLLWSGFGDWLDPQWGFTGRHRQPPPDPVNAMLSLGFTHLYALTDALLRSVGLWPYSSAYHQPRGNHACLASDMMEPYRHHVEQTVLSLINRGQVKLEDFSQPQVSLGMQDKARCEMSSEARKVVFTALSKRFYYHQPTPPIDKLCGDILALKRAVFSVEKEVYQINNDDSG